MTQAPILARLPKGADLLEAIATLCRDQNLTRASIQAIGALEKAQIGFYLQEERRYVSHDLPYEVELLAAMGNLSIKDDQPFPHLHVTLGDREGRCLGGHAMPGCIVFACEVAVIPIPGPALVRTFDEPTGLYLWA